MFWSGIAEISVEEKEKFSFQGILNLKTQHCSFKHNHRLWFIFQAFNLLILLINHLKTSFLFIICTSSIRKWSNHDIKCKLRKKTKVDGKSMYSDIKLALGENKNWTTWIKYCFVILKCFVANETGKILMQWYQVRLSRQSDSLRNSSNISKKPFPRACWQS